MKRKTLKSLEIWKKSENRKPLILLGARQVGKSYLVDQFAEESRLNYHKFDFEKDSSLKKFFETDLSPERICSELSLYQRAKGLPSISAGDLIFFDEIQECPNALASLRYFYENKHNSLVISAGSLLGDTLTDKFPVGRVELQKIYPMNFEEFLWASGNETAIQMFREKSRLLAAHEVLWPLFIDFLFVGGMPEAVKNWFLNNESRPDQQVMKIQQNILDQYKMDFAKHSGKTNSEHIVRVFENIPSQLAKNQDASVKRFQFKNVLPGQTKFQRLSGPIEWLTQAGLCLPSKIIDGKVEVPLKAFAKENLFKLFSFDVGLLGRQLELSYLNQKNQNFGLSKGFIAENFVATELTACEKTLYSWQSNSAEIEFLIAHNDLVIPIEIKSGTRTQAKSLKSFVEKFHPEYSIKLIGNAGGSDSKNLVLPLYYAGCLSEFLQT